MIDNFLSKGHIYLNDSNAFKYIDIHNGGDNVAISN